LEAAYRARPPYQRSDYIGWITRATPVADAEWARARRSIR